MNSIKDLKEQIINSQKIAIIGHKNSDVDCLASMVSLKRVILANAQVFGDNKIIDLFSDFDEIDEIYEPITKNEFFKKENLEPYNLAICLDCSSIDRIAENKTVFENALNSVSIDHHENYQNFAKINLVYKCSSTCELLYIVFKALSLEVSNDVLKMLYAGIVTDTVNLTQGTVKVSSYRTVAEIAEKVNDMEALNAIKDHFLKNKTKSNLLLLERAIRSMNFYLNDRLAVMKITKEDLEDADGNQTDTLGIVNNAINIKGVAIAILFIKQEDGSYYASIRSKNGVDVSKIAEALGGGGHETVAAFTHGQNLSELKGELLSLCEKALENENIDNETDSLFGD